MAAVQAAKSPRSWIFLSPYIPSFLVTAPRARGRARAAFWTGLGSVHFIFMQLLLNQKPINSVKTRTMSSWLLHIEHLTWCLEGSRLNIFHLVFVEPLASVWQYFCRSLVDSSMVLCDHLLSPSHYSLLSFPTPSLLSSFLFKIPPEGNFIPSTLYKPDISLLSSSCYIYATYQF